MPVEPPELEWQTRKRLVDPKLEASGWKVSAFREEQALSACNMQALTEFPTSHGPADYALCPRSCSGSTSRSEGPPGGFGAESSLSRQPRVRPTGGPSVVQVARPPESSARSVIAQ